jgi:hypothetical protein
MGPVGATTHARTMETAVRTSVPHVEFAPNVPPAAPTKSVVIMGAVDSVESAPTMKCAPEVSA